MYRPKNIVDSTLVLAVVQQHMVRQGDGRTQQTHGEATPKKVFKNIIL